MTMLAIPFVLWHVWGLEYPVSMESFNKFVIQPISHFEFQLAPPASHVPIQLQLVPTDARRILFQNMLARAHLIVDFVLDYTIKQHNDSSNLLALCPNNIPAAWKNAIIGKLDRSELKIVDMPSIIELKIRIQISLDYALDLKRTNVRAHFYTTQSGSAWHQQISLDDSINISDLYLKACSSFPKILGDLLEQKGTTIDKLAGVEPAGRYPGEPSSAMAFPVHPLLVLNFMTCTLTTARWEELFLVCTMVACLRNGLHLILSTQIIITSCQIGG
jgi:hypothetical protein